MVRQGHQFTHPRGCAGAVAPARHMSSFDREVNFLSIVQFTNRHFVGRQHSKIHEAARL